MLEKTKQKATDDRSDSGKKNKTVKKTEKKSRKEAVQVVGIGASAGGLEALSKFFKAMPSDSGMAFVVVQHLDPNHKSLMGDLLAKYTDMKVVQAESDMPLEPNHVYVIAPNTYLTLTDGKLTVSEPVKVRGMRMPIDYFFRSLGETRQEKAICIVLSGTATDGTLGLRTVKSHGGLGLVQDPETATHDGMPKSAISTGMVDFVLPVEEMPKVIIKYVRHPFVRDAEKVVSLPDQAQDDLQGILAILRTRTNHNFKWYKENTIIRRIQRRISLNHLDSYAQYLDYLRNHPLEVEQLAKELLISVTDWFRDKKAWEELKKKVVPELFKQQQGGQPIRIWVAGCATGEEAYSMAILFNEVAEELQVPPNFIVFATEVNSDSLEFARNGVYPDAIADEIARERLERFFVKEGQAYRVKKNVRESIIFAQQNLLSDPPFSRLDLITCRNLLIYLVQDVQKKVLSLFHFALKHRGVLFLGNSETVTQQKNLYEAVSKKWRIYRKTGVTHGNLELPVNLDEKKYPELGQRELLYTGRRRPNVADLARDIMLEKFVPASVLVDSSFQVLYFQGNHEKFLLQPPGEPTNDLLAIAREGLRLRLRGALNNAWKKKEETVVQDARVKKGKSSTRVRITVDPVEDRYGAEGLLLVTFEEVKVPETSKPQIEKPAAESDLMERQLEEELKLTKQELQSTIEELETSNEELKSSNEEVMSMNEELQSANEELETSKEELQSMNEELTTVNAQLEEKVKELENTNNDLRNLLNSTDIATIFLDTNLRIKRYTPATQKVFNYLPSDIGRPISDLSHQAMDPALPEECRKVLEDLQPEQKEISDNNGRWFIRRTIPYRTEDNRIDGVVITFSDITEIKRAERKLQKSKDLADAINHINELIHSTLEFDDILSKVCEKAIDPLHMEAFSIGFLEDDEYVFKYAHKMPEEFLDERLFLHDIKGVEHVYKTKGVVGFNDAVSDERLSRELVAKYNIKSMMIAPLVVRGDVVGTLNFYCLTGPLTFTDLQIDYARKLADTVSLAMDNAYMYEVLQRAEEEASRNFAEMQGLYNSVPGGLCFVDTDLCFVKINERLAALNGHSVDEHMGRTIREMLPQVADKIEPYYRQVIETGVPLENFEFRDFRNPNLDEEKYWLASYYPVKDEEGRVLGVSTLIQDISDLKQAEMKLADNEKLLRQMLEIMPVGVWVTDDCGKIIKSNPAGKEIWDGTEYVSPDDFDKYKVWWYDSKKPLVPEEWAITRAITKGESSIDEVLEIETLKGEHKIISNSAVPLHDEKGKTKGVIVVNLDITESKKLEENLMRSNRELKQFAYVASHDIKEPLRMISSYLGLINRRYRDQLDEKFVQFIDFAIEGSVQLNELIDELLTFSRIESTGRPLVRTDMEKVFTKSVKNLKFTITEKEAEIEHEPLPAVQGDEKQLVQLMQNLLSNALKFSNDKNRPKVQIRVEEDGAFYRFSIRDNGIGMDPQYAEKIFIIFQRLHSRQEYSGTGIGLAICKKIVERHGGRIWVESEPGKGSTFYFTLRKAL